MHNKTLAVIALILSCSTAVAHEPFVMVRATQFSQCGPMGCNPYVRRPMAPRVMQRPQVILQPQMPIPPAQDPGSLPFGYLECNGVCIANSIGKSGQPGSWVLTVAHLFANARAPEVRVRSVWHDAELVGKDNPRDLALLWVPGVTMPSLEIATFDPQPNEIAILHVYDILDGGTWVEPYAMIDMSPMTDNGIARWGWTKGVKQGWSGGAYTTAGKLIGIQSAGTNQFGVIVQRESILKFLKAQVELNDPEGIRSAIDDLTDLQPIQQEQPDGNETESDRRQAELYHGLKGLQAQIEDLKKQANQQDKAKPVIKDDKSEQSDASGKPPVEPSGIAPVPQAPGGSLLKDIERVGGYISNGWTWAKFGTYIGGPAGVAIGIAGFAFGFLKQRRKDREQGHQGPTPISNPIPSHQPSPGPADIPLTYAQPPRPYDNLSQDPGQRPTVNQQEDQGPRPAPFPRFLDEANQLRKIRESEGRVPALDSLVGMIFDDEFRNAMESDNSTEAERSALRKLRQAIDQKVDEIAPISVKAS